MTPNAGAAGTVRSKVNHNLNAEEPAMHQPEEAINFTPEERATVERFEAAPTLTEAWETPWDDIFVPGAPVEVHEVGGGYVVFPRNRGMGLS